jgi:Na+/melibiose symporter-like transporter
MVQLVAKQMIISEPEAPYMQEDNKEQIEQRNKNAEKKRFILNLIIDVLILALFIGGDEMNRTLKAIIIVLIVVIVLCKYIVATAKEEGHNNEEDKEHNEQDSQKKDKKADNKSCLEQLPFLVALFFVMGGDSIPREFWIVYIVVCMIISTLVFLAKQRKPRDENRNSEPYDFKTIDDDTYLDFIANHELVLIYFYDGNAIDDIIHQMKMLQQECKKSIAMGYYDISDKNNRRFFDDNEMQSTPSIIIYQGGIEVNKCHGSFSAEDLSDF